VRNDLGIKMHRGTNECEELGVEMQKILEAIKDWRIVPSTLKCFEE